MRSIVLSGFAGTGKTTLGAKLATKLGLPFVDTDEEIERRAGAAIPSLWLERGEAGFRQLEREVAHAALRGGPRVIAFGGGTVTQRELRHDALEAATVVTLRADVATLVRRTEGVTRPLLAGPDRAERIEQLLAARAEAYAECHGSLDTSAGTEDDAVEALAAMARDGALVMPLGARSYRYACVDGDLGACAAAVRSLAPTSVTLVTDTNVERARRAYVDELTRQLGAARVVLSPGEPHKTLSAVSSLWDAMLGGELDRDGVVVALGGGVVGDLAGFAAATALRGVRWVAAPTTLLAMVDASIGGKTGFDHASGKNRVGAFHQPSAVIADLAHLETLPARESRAGMAEVVKIALGADEELFAALEPGARGGSTMRRVVLGAAAAKIRLVKDDEFERSGTRALLNLGHTVGHAIEAATGYATWLHGEAVAMGLVAELAATHRLGLTPSSVVSDARRVLDALGLPVEMPSIDALDLLRTDKKRSGAFITLPIVREIGEASVERIPLQTLVDALRG